MVKFGIEKVQKMLHAPHTCDPSFPSQFPCVHARSSSSSLKRPKNVSSYPPSLPFPPSFFHFPYTPTRKKGEIGKRNIFLPSLPPPKKCARAGERGVFLPTFFWSGTSDARFPNTGVEEFSFLENSQSAAGKRNIINGPYREICPSKKIRRNYPP